MIIISLCVLIVGLFGHWLLGFVIARTILNFATFRFPKPNSLQDDQSGSSLSVCTGVELAGLGCVLGVGLTAWFLFLWSLFGGELGLLPGSLLAIAGFVTGGPLMFRQWRSRRSECQRQTENSDARRQERAVCQACQALIAFLVATTLLQALQTPQKLWDERAIFALKARVLFEERSIHSPVLYHPDFVQYHPRYPLLLPLAEQNIYAFLGHDNDRLSKLIFPWLYCGLILTTVGVLLRRTSDGRAWLAGLVMATVPVLVPYEYGFLCGQADAPTACFHGLSVLYLWDSFMDRQHPQSRTGRLLMAGILGGLTAFTKDEGIAFLMIDAAILGLLTLGSIGNLHNLKRSIGGISLFVVAAGFLLIPWFVHRRNLPYTTEMNYFGRMTPELFVSRLETLYWSLPHLVHRMFWEWREWGLQWWLMLAAMISRPRKLFQPARVVLLLDVAGALAALLVAGMLAPAQLDEHIGGSSHRFLMQLAPVAVLFAITSLSGDGTESDSQRRSADVHPGPL